VIAVGNVVEVGNLDDEGSALGVVLRRDDGTFVTVKGLTVEETRAAGALLFQQVSLTLSAGAPP
jgi:hypothetical protein